MKKSFGSWLRNTPGLKVIHKNYISIYWPTQRWLQFLSRKFTHVPKKNRSEIVDYVYLVTLFRQNFKNVPLLRIGASGDGGYLVPDNLSGIEACFSPGVGVNADFEKGMLEMGIPCYLADASVDGPPISSDLLHFEKKFIGSPQSDPRFTTLSGWVAGVTPDASELVLQMDIEGSEWEVLDYEPTKTLARFRILVIEFHDLQMLFKRGGLELATRVFKKIFKDFYVVNIHPNNGDLPVKKYGVQIPPLVEITFLRKDSWRITQSGPFTSVDANEKNDSRYKDVTLANLKANNKKLFAHVQ